MCIVGFPQSRDPTLVYKGRSDRGKGSGVRDGSIIRRFQPNRWPAIENRGSIAWRDLL